MSNTLHRGKSALAPKLPGAGRAVASAELRMQIQMADLQGLLDELHVHTDCALNPDGEIDLNAYRLRIEQLDSARHDLEASVNRLSDLIFVGADTLLITIGRSVCQTLERILESANAQVCAVEDGA